MIRRLVLVSFVAMLGFASPASANMFVHKDSDFGFTFAYPDTWRLQTPDQATTRVRVAGPVGEDMATCKIKAERDGRLTVYPKRHMEAAVNQTLTREFWDNETGQFDNVDYVFMRGSAGLGQGDATAVRVNYDQKIAKDTVARMTATMISTVYGENRFTMSCSSRTEAFSRWSELFGNIINTVKLEDRYTVFPNGYYRDFLSDPSTWRLPRKNRYETRLNN